MLSKGQHYCHTAVCKYGVAKGLRLGLGLGLGLKLGLRVRVRVRAKVTYTRQNRVETVHRASLL